VSDYQPMAGEHVLVTVHAKVTAFGDYAVRGFMLRKDDPAVVSVVPAPIELPTLPGAVIRGVVDGAEQTLSLTGHEASDSEWTVLGAGYHILGSSITRVVEVLFPGVES
jgi:hypothetical protein